MSWDKEVSMSPEAPFISNQHPVQTGTINFETIISVSGAPWVAKGNHLGRAIVDYVCR